MREALRGSASALKAADVPFALAGSYALWVYGGPEGDHDVDLVVPEASVEEAARTLADAGFLVERPPEDWLFKAWRDGVLVDVLHRLVGIPVEPDLVLDADAHDVLGIRMPVLPPTVVITTKVLSLSEQYCDLGTLLPGARAVRERIDWTQVRAAAADHPYAEAFLFLATRLGIAD
jgi:CBS domain-containing protein